MNNDRAIATLAAAMVEFDAGDPKRIQHLLKVHDFARTIGLLEGLDGQSLFTLETAALVHDIAILPCEAEWGRCDGKMQEREGPIYAAALLKELNFPPEVVERACWLVGHHHTYDDIQEPDYQILVEADFLVNLYEDNASADAVRTAGERIFRTETGRTLLEHQFSR